jgi:hypothetical protein
MFVIMALVTTFSTTPLTKWLYPLWYQQKLEKWRRGEIDWNGNPLRSDDSSQQESIDKLNQTQIRRLLVFLRLDSLPAMLTFISLMGTDSVTNQLTPPPTSGATLETPGSEKAEDGSPNVDESTVIRRRPLEVHGLRLLELTDRTSSVMQVTEGDEYSDRDPVVNTFRTVSRLNNVAVSGRVAVVPTDSYAEMITTQAQEISSDFALVPWSEYGSLLEDDSVPLVASAHDRFSARGHLEFIHDLLAMAKCNTGIFINNGFGGAPRFERPRLQRTVSSVSMRSQRDPPLPPVLDKTHHVFFPFFGGVDDRVAIRFVLQLAKHKNVTATIVHFNYSDDGEDVTHPPEVIVAGGSGQPASRAARGKEVMSNKIVEDVTAQDLALFSTLQSSLPPELVGSVTFTEVNTTRATAINEALALAKSTVAQNKNSGDIIVVGRRHGKLDIDAAESMRDLRSAVGALGDQVIAHTIKASTLVIQAGGKGLEW